MTATAHSQSCDSGAVGFRQNNISMNHSSNRPMISAGLLAILSIVFASLLVNGQESTESEKVAKIQTVSGKSKSVADLSISADGQLAGSGLDEPLTLEDVLSIAFADAETSESAGTNDTATHVKLLLRGGSYLDVEGLTISDEVCRFQLNGAPFELGIDSIQAVQLDSSRKSQSYEEGSKKPLSELDRIYLKIDNDVQSVNGVVEAVTESRLSFLLGDESKEIPIANVYGFVIADFGESQPPSGNATISLASGGYLKGRIEQFNNDSLVAVVGHEAKLQLPRELVTKVGLRSDRLLFLSDVEPVRSEMKPLVTYERPYQKDLSVDGNPLTLRNANGETARVFAKGLGTHAESILVYENPGFDRFAATIGLDTETDGKGDCVFLVQANGQTLFEKRVKASDAPVEVSLEISNVKQFSLVVQPGADLDLADHANWCDARLLKDRQ